MVMQILDMANREQGVPTLFFSLEMGDEIVAQRNLSRQSRMRLTDIRDGKIPKEKLFDAAEFFLECMNANAPLVAVENPVMHKYARQLIGRRPDFTVQPWMFGDDFKKRTCFWTRGLPPLRPTSDLDGKTAIAGVHLEPPGPNRKANRSRTYPGIANAIADWAESEKEFSCK